MHVIQCSQMFSISSSNYSPPPICQKKFAHFSFHYDLNLWNTDQKIFRLVKKLILKIARYQKINCLFFGSK